jgi:endonuclease YncB( thermonuclease family)
VIDGDGLKIGEGKIRLVGIDAPKCAAAPKVVIE